LRHDEEEIVLVYPNKKIISCVQMKKMNAIILPRIKKYFNPIFGILDKFPNE